MNKNIKAGERIHQGGGYEIGTQQGYETSKRLRNKSLAYKRIIELSDVAFQYSLDAYDQSPDKAIRIRDIYSQKLTELVIQDTLNLLRDEWYALNNIPKPSNETPRDVGMRIGSKGQVIKLMEKIKDYFGVTDE